MQVATDRPARMQSYPFDTHMETIAIRPRPRFRFASRFAGYQNIYSFAAFLASCTGCLFDFAEMVWPGYVTRLQSFIENKPRRSVFT